MAPPSPGNEMESDIERRLVYRFLTLPWRKQLAIALSLDLLTDDDRARSDGELLEELYRRATEKRLRWKLWDETEKHHPDPAANNPFVT